MADNCENITDENKLSCSDMYNCCDCGVEDGEEGCGCAYCWSCNTCETCKDE